MNSGAISFVVRMDEAGPKMEMTAVSAMGSSAEAALLEAVRRGDERAFEQIVLRYKDRVYNYILRMVGRREPAEDLTQEVFVRVFLAAQTLKQHTSFIAWLYRIANNICIDEHRRRKHEKDLVTSLDDPIRTQIGEVQMEVPDESRNPEKVAGRRELRDAVRAAIDALPPKMRSVVLLFDLEGLSYEEIAEAVGCPVGTVKSRLFNGRAQLKDLLRGYVLAEGQEGGE